MNENLKSHRQKKMPIWSYKKLNQTLKEMINPALHKLLQNIGKEPLPRSLYESVTMVIPNQARIVEERKTIGSVSYWCKTNLLKKILANKINQWIDDMNITKLDLSWEFKSGVMSKQNKQTYYFDQRRNLIHHLNRFRQWNFHIHSKLKKTDHQINGNWTEFS